MFSHLNLLLLQAREMHSTADSSTMNAYPELIRAWHFFDRGVMPNPAWMSAPHTMVDPQPKSTTTQFFRQQRPWLSSSDVLAARLPRGPLPIWRSRSFPTSCSEWKDVKSLPRRDADRASAPDEHVGPDFLTDAEAEAAAEIDFWLGCLQTGVAICRVAMRSHDRSAWEAPRNSTLERPVRLSFTDGFVYSVQDVKGDSLQNIQAVGSDDKAQDPHAEVGAILQPPAVQGALLRVLLRRRERLSSLRVLVVHDMLPLPHAMEGGGRRAAQLLDELAAEGHAITYISAGELPRKRDVDAARDAGWQAFSPACSLTRHRLQMPLIYLHSRCSTGIDVRAVYWLCS